MMVIGSVAILFLACIGKSFCSAYGDGVTVYYDHIDHGLGQQFISSVVDDLALCDEPSHFTTSLQHTAYLKAVQAIVERDGDGQHVYLTVMPNVQFLYKADPQTFTVCAQVAVVSSDDDHLARDDIYEDVFVFFYYSDDRLVVTISVDGRPDMFTGFLWEYSDDEVDEYIRTSMMEDQVDGDLLEAIISITGSQPFATHVLSWLQSGKRTMCTAVIRQHRATGDHILQACYGVSFKPHICGEWAVNVILNERGLWEVAVIGQ